MSNKRKIDKSDDIDDLSIVQIDELLKSQKCDLNHFIKDDKQIFNNVSKNCDIIYC